jgi:predicted nucleotidyltransferase
MINVRPGRELHRRAMLFARSRSRNLNTVAACDPRVFGSVVHGDDTDNGDLNILIDPTPNTTLFDIGAIRHELLQLLGVPVDVLTPKALPEKFRATVLSEAVPV